MKRQQRVVDLGKIMAIPQRLEILADYGLQHGARARDASELGKCSRQSAEMMQHVDAGNRVHRARAQRKSDASERIQRAEVFCAPISTIAGERSSAITDNPLAVNARGVIAGAGADFEDGSSAQRPKTFDQRVTAIAGLDAPRIVIGGGNLAVVDRSRNWHGKRLDDVLRPTMRPPPVLRQTTNAARNQNRRTKKRQPSLDEVFLGRPDLR